MDIVKGYYRKEEAMKNRSKRYLALLLSVMMVFSTFGFTSFAFEGEAQNADEKNVASQTVSEEPVKTEEKAEEPAKEEPAAAEAEKKDEAAAQEVVNEEPAAAVESEPEAAPAEGSEEPEGETEWNHNVAVTFNANGGHFDEQKTTVEKTGTGSGTTFIIDFAGTLTVNNAPVAEYNDYHEFVEWNTEEDGSGRTATLSNGNLTLSNFSSTTREITFYAQWKHTHNWNLVRSQDRTYVTATCQEEDCEYHTNSPRMTLKAENAAYTGERYNAEENVSYEWTLNGEPVTDESVTKSLTAGNPSYEIRRNNRWDNLQNAPINSGTYRTEIVFTADNGRTVALRDEFRITPLDVFVTFDNKTKYAKQEDPEFTYTVTKMDGTEFEPAAGDFNVAAQRESGENPGYYKISVNTSRTSYDDDNYNVTWKSGYLTIIDGDADYPSPLYAEYDAEEHELVHSPDENLEDGYVFEYAFADEDGKPGEFSREIPTATNAGEYTIYYRIVKDIEGTVDVVRQPAKVSPSPEIFKKEVTISVEDFEGTYNILGRRQANEVVVNGYVDDDSPVYYSTQSIEEPNQYNSLTRLFNSLGILNGTYRDARENPYNLYYYVDLGNNYVLSEESEFGVSGVELVKINPIEFTITADDKEITYGDAEPQYTFSVIGIDLPVGLIVSADCDYDTSDPAKRGAGEYDITLEVAGSDEINLGNFKIVLEPGKLTVNPFNINANWTLDGQSDYFELVYDGQIHFVKVDAESGEPDREIPYDGVKLKQSGDIQETNAGDYIVFAELDKKDADNFVIDEETLTKEWKIQKANLAITANDIETVYGEAAVGRGAKYDGFAEGDDPGDLRGRLSYQIGKTETVDGKSSYTEYNPGDDVGEYDVVVKGQSSNNYNIEYFAGKMTVVPRHVTFTWSTPDTFTYDSTKKTVEVRKVNNLYGKDKVEVKYADNAKTDVGSYKAKVVSLNNDNYEFAGEETSSYAWMINKAVLVAKADAKGSSKAKLNWNTVPGAVKYEVYWSKCNVDGKDYTPKKTKTTTGKTYTKKGLKRGICYKFYVKAIGADGKVINKSKVIHVIAGQYNNNYTNAKSLKLNASEVSLKTGGTFKIKATQKKVKNSKKLLDGNHAALVRCTTTNSSVATVSESGTIKAVGTGWCKIYVQTVNGIWKTVEVTVK